MTSNLLRTPVIISLFIHIHMVFSQMHKSETLTPFNRKVNGAEIFTNYLSVSTSNNTWIARINSQIGWQFIVMLDDSWGFDPIHYSSITITVNSPTVNPVIPTFDALIFAFASNNAEYISTFIPMDNSQSNLIYPHCRTTSTSPPIHGIGDIASAPYSNRKCDVAGGSCANWQNMFPINLPQNRDVFPIVFKLESDPKSDTLRFSFTTSGFHPEFEQFCYFTAPLPSRGLKIYIGGNERLQLFTIKSVRLQAITIVKFPTTQPTISPTKNPTARTMNPTNRPTMPTNEPSFHPTKPTIYPTDAPIITRPTVFPTGSPTNKPTPHPTKYPTNRPTNRPTKYPSNRPTNRPTNKPTNVPTNSPTRRTGSPTTDKPTMVPSNSPTNKPTMRPTNYPTKRPTNHPTKKPTNRPTNNPTKRPTNNPTKKPTNKPTPNPTDVPSRNPTSDPTQAPSANPTKTPTDVTKAPTNNPTHKPTTNPTEATNIPSPSPTTTKPTAKPTMEPTVTPTIQPTVRPTIEPTPKPTTAKPTAPIPTPEPTLEPTPKPFTAIPTIPAVPSSSFPSFIPSQAAHEPSVKHKISPTKMDTIITIDVNVEATEHNVIGTEEANVIFAHVVVQHPNESSLIRIIIICAICLSCGVIGRIGYCYYSNDEYDQHKVEHKYEKPQQCELPKLLKPPAFKPVTSCSVTHVHLIRVHFDKRQFNYAIEEERDIEDELGEYDKDEYHWDDTTYQIFINAVTDEFDLHFTEFRLYEIVGGERENINGIDDIIVAFDCTINTTENHRSIDLYLQIIENISDVFPPTDTETHASSKRSRANTASTVNPRSRASTINTVNTVNSRSTTPDTMDSVKSSRRLTCSSTYSSGLKEDAREQTMQTWRKILSTTKDTKWRHRAYKKMGLVEEKRGNVDKAMQYYCNALDEDDDDVLEEKVMELIDGSNTSDVTVVKSYDRSITVTNPFADDPISIMHSSRSPNPISIMEKSSTNPFDFYD